MNKFSNYTLQQVLKQYNQQDILNIHSMSEIFNEVSMTAYYHNKKVLIARNIKHIRILPRSVEVLISDSLETLDLDDTYDEFSELKVIICPKLKELDFVPKTIEQLIINSCKTINFIEDEYFGLLKLYADSLIVLENLNAPNLKYLSINSVKDLNLKENKIMNRYMEYFSANSVGYQQFQSDNILQTIEKHSLILTECSL